jgi:hypothetical protein
VATPRLHRPASARDIFVAPLGTGMSTQGLEHTRPDGTHHATVRPDMAAERDERDDPDDQYDHERRRQPAA